LREATDGNVIDPCRSLGVNGVEIDPAARLGRDPTGHKRDSFAQYCRPHVVQQQPRGARLQRRFDLVP